MLDTRRVPAFHPSGVGTTPPTASAPAGPAVPVPAFPRPEGTAQPGQSAPPVTVSVLAGDRIIGEGTVSYLMSCPSIKVLSVDKQQDAEVVLAIVDTVNEETLRLMERAARASARPPRFVLIGEDMRERHLLRALSWGPVSVIPRREADFDSVVQCILEARDGKVQLPASAVGWLVHHYRSVRQEMLDEYGVTPARLAAREVEVLRLLADGFGTREVAARLNYSERTIKTIIQSLLARLNMRNRTQAVAYAVKMGEL